ncbi:hypothetical protein ONS95_003502 [Cadophora gregata]|uniref:uncharacterized protein n=1 Tax=Cadophora gregata TaxID=51156 RepID=UPI0026DCB0B5|nr:uncharacterized protein ONS95_003502 [Cadophora gregata]KAK0099430.1 hypothetical protein ONS96_008454 [Cadophora gregata f. sp. sojae]KAK0106778.1 hypothetical protein ONS95_003502 [Cadophora gregata]
MSCGIWYLGELFAMHCINLPPSDKTSARSIQFKLTVRPPPRHYYSSTQQACCLACLVSHHTTPAHTSSPHLTSTGSSPTPIQHNPKAKIPSFSLGYRTPNANPAVHGKAQPPQRYRFAG